MEINKKNTLILLLFFTAVNVIAFLIVPGWQSIGFKKNEIKNRESELSILKDVLVQTEELKQLLSEERVKKVFLALPKEKEIPFLLIQFEGLAFYNGLILESVNFGKVTETKDQGGEVEIGEVSAGAERAVSPSLKSLTVNLNVSGSYSAFRNYLRDLEKNIPLMDVGSINFISKVSDIFDFNFTAKVYLQ